MKIKNEQEIIELAQAASIDFHEYENHYFIIAFEKAYTQAQQELLASASEGFEEWQESQIQRIVGMDEATAENTLKDLVTPEGVWQAAILSQAKELKKIKDDWEEAATKNYSDKTTIEDLQKENKELRKDLEWAIDELDGFIADDDCPYYLQNIKSIKDKWLKGNAGVENE